MAKYWFGDVAIITGTGFTPNTTVTLSVTNPLGVVVSWSVVSDENGGFTTSYIVDGVLGTNTLVATDGTNTATTTFEDPTVNIDQCKNGATTPPLGNILVPCGTSNPPAWANGNLNHQNSQYREGDGVPYRMSITGLTNGANTVKI